MRASPTDPAQRGFTMAELLLVLLILGTLAVTALPRLDAGLGMAGSAHRDELISALRNAHTTAMASRRLVCVTVLNAQTTAVVASSADASECPGLENAVRGSVILLFQADGTVEQSDAAVPADTITLSVTDQPDVTVYAASGDVE